MKAYIIRIQKDGDGRVAGHVGDPLTQERFPFRNWTELWQILNAGLEAPAGRALPRDLIPEEAGDEPLA